MLWGVGPGSPRIQGRGAGRGSTGMNEEWLRWFPANPPARQGAKLPARIPGLKVSIAAIAEA